MAKNVPRIMLPPPIYGPSIRPYRGATMSEVEKVAVTPIMGNVGISLSTV